MALALFVIAGVAVVTNRTMGGLERAMDSVERTNLLLRALERAYTGVSEAEAASHGFILTGDSSYLEPYRGAEAAVAGDLARIDSLTIGGAQARRLATLRPLVARRFDAIDHMVRTREREGMGSALALVRTGAGKALMDSVRVLIDAMESDELAALARRSRRERIGMENTAQLIVFGIAVTWVIGVLAAIVVRRDARAASRSQRELREAKEAAEAASRAKSDFLARMSHELRTPLNSVIGFSNILLRTALGRLTPQELEYLGRVRANGVHLLALINDVLDLSKVEAGRMRLDLEVVDLDTLIHDTLAGFEGQLRDRDVELRAEVPAQMEQLVTDSAKLLQVLLNLIGNALKFTERGSVTVRVVADEATRVPARIDVIDTGVGVPAERRGAIFEAFEQADSGTSRRFGGTGLGLSISRALCDLMGYRLEVAGGPGGVGSVFSIVLARHHARPPHPPHRRSPRPTTLKKL